MELHHYFKINRCLQQSKQSDWGNPVRLRFYSLLISFANQMWNLLKKDTMK